MGRSATNAVGNSIASAVVAKWEGGLLSEEEAEAKNVAFWHHCFNFPQPSVGDDIDRHHLAR
jgi:hypothetical protein